MRLLGRLKQFLERRKKFEPFGHVVSGRLAEFRLLKLTRAVAGNALVLEGIRIPDPDEGGRREIDLVIATKDRLLVVEQKHWSGSFNIQEDGRFLQTRKNGSTLLHKDIIQWTARKGRILCDLHKSRCGLNNLEPEVVLVFSNKNLEWSQLPENSDAVAFDELGFINMVEKLDRTEPEDDWKETLLGFGTWDTIHLNGGRTVHGDIIEYPYGKEDCTVKHSGILGIITGPKSLVSNGNTVVDLSGPLVAVVGEDEARIILPSLFNKLIYVGMLFDL